MIDLALGKEPVLPRGDGRTTSPPSGSPTVQRRRGASPASDNEIAAVLQDVPGTTIELIVEEGDRLSDLTDQDSYSYGLANIHIGAKAEAELIEK